MPFLPATDFPVDVLPSGDVRNLAPVAWLGHHGDRVDVAPGYVSDWGSVPWLVRAVLPNAGPLCRAFLVHDVLCTAHDAVHAARAGRGPAATPEQLALTKAFDAVDVDAVLRLILAELGDVEAAAGRRRPIGTGPARWLYWEGVRAGALGNPARRGGFLRPRSVLPFLALAVPTLVAVAPAAVGALVSRGLMALGDVLAWPWEARARRERVRAGERARAEHVAGILGRAAQAPPCTCTPTEGDADCARPEHRERVRARSVLDRALMDPASTDLDRREAARAMSSEPAAPVKGDPGLGCVCCRTGAEPGPPPPLPRHTAWSHPDGTGGCTCGWLPDPADPRARAVQAFEHIQATRDDRKQAGL